MIFKSKPTERQTDPEEIPVKFATKEDETLILKMMEKGTAASRLIMLEHPNCTSQQAAMYGYLHGLSEVVKVTSQIEKAKRTVE